MIRLHQLSRSQPELANGLRLISLSFDPENDTPARMAGYSMLAGSDKRGAEWHFLTTASQSKLRPILEAYGQAVDKKRDLNDPTGPLNHTLRVFLIDAEGRVRNVYSSGTLDLRLVLADVETLKRESTQVGATSRRPNMQTAETQPGFVLSGLQVSPVRGSLRPPLAGRCEQLPIASDPYHKRPAHL
jgi:hypothetical protein